jgi:hypothetical protein
MDTGVPRVAPQYLGQCDAADVYAGPELFGYRQLCPNPDVSSCGVAERSRIEDHGVSERPAP